MTGLPAEPTGLSGRGYVRVGSAADVVVFDLSQMRARSWFTELAAYAEGVGLVVVNGVTAFRDDERTADDACQVLRRAS